MIFGLIAALGCGLADLVRRAVGAADRSLWAVVVAQVAAAVVITAILLVVGPTRGAGSTGDRAVVLNGVCVAART